MTLHISAGPSAGWENDKKIGKNVCYDLETCTSSSRSTLTKPKFTAIGMVEVVTVYCTFSTFDRPFRISVVISLLSIITCEIFCLTQFAQLSKDLKSSSIVETQVNPVLPDFQGIFVCLKFLSLVLLKSQSLSLNVNVMLIAQASIVIQPTSSTMSKSRVGSGRTATQEADQQTGILFPWCFF